MKMFDRLRRMVFDFQYEPMPDDYVSPDDEMCRWTGFHIVCDSRDDAMDAADHAIDLCLMRIYGCAFKGIPTKDGRYRTDLYIFHIPLTEARELAPRFFPGYDVRIDQVTVYDHTGSLDFDSIGEPTSVGVADMGCRYASYRLTPNMLDQERVNVRAVGGRQRHRFNGHLRFAERCGCCWWSGVHLK